jgi:hypothetical protein
MEQIKVIKTYEELDSLIVDGNLIYDGDIALYVSVNIKGNIEVKNILTAMNITAKNITCHHARAWDVEAEKLDCWDFAGENISIPEIDCHAFQSVNLSTKSIKYVNILFVLLSSSVWFSCNKNISTRND